MTTDVVTPDVADVEATDQADALAGFNTTDGDLPPPEPAKVAESVEPIPDAPEPKLISLTEQQWTDVQAKVDQLEQSLTRERTTTSGKLGEFNQTLRDLKASQGARKVSVEQFAEIAEDYPDIVKGIVNGFNAGVPDVEPKPEVAAFDPEKIRQDAREVARAEARMAAFEDRHPDWQEVRGHENFKAWIRTHSAEQQSEILNSNDPKYVGDVLTAFKVHREAEAEKLKPKPPVNRLAAAITPTGAPPAGRTTQSERAEMQKAFDSVQ